MEHSVLLRNKRPKQSRRLSVRLSWSWRWVHTYVCMYSMCLSVHTALYVVWSLHTCANLQRQLSQSYNTVPHLLTASAYRLYVHTYVHTCQVHIPGASLTFVQTLELEKKQLYQQWTNSLIGMQRRDEAFAAMRTALRCVRTYIHIVYQVNIKLSARKQASIVAAWQFKQNITQTQSRQSLK